MSRRCRIGMVPLNILAASCLINKYIFAGLPMYMRSEEKRVASSRGYVGEIAFLMHKPRIRICLWRRLLPQNTAIDLRLLDDAREPSRYRGMWVMVRRRNGVWPEYATQDGRRVRGCLYILNGTILATPTARARLNSRLNWGRRAGCRCK